jgi:hypothetical protein
MKKVLVILWFVQAASGQSYFHYQTSAARPLAMGGAFTAVQDFHSSLAWNPAALVLAKDRAGLAEETYFKVNFDLLSLGTALIGWGINSAFLEEDEEMNGKTACYLAQMTLYSIRGFTLINKNNLLVSVNLHEDLLDYQTTFGNIFDNSYQSLTASWQVGREFAVGGSYNYYQVWDGEKRFNGGGYNLGLQYNSLQFKKLYYGISWFAFDDPVQNVRSRIERIFNRSLTFGLAWQSGSWWTVAGDFRNINRPSDDYFAEVHVGLEERIAKNFYLRQGGFLTGNNIGKPVFSFGAGYTTRLFRTTKPWILDFGLALNIRAFGDPSRYDGLLTLRAGI